MSDPRPSAGCNRLIDEPSPYLQQHAHNPVDWYPWSDAALARAKAEDKPILLSIGYAACHWCHVMAHESFENPETAAFMNEHFINIKVDREERPDLDAIYQTVCQMVTRHGGWPLTVFLTPERKPFFVGTYFPPEPRHGLQSFPHVLAAISGAWQNHRQEVEEVAESWTKALQRGEQLPVAAELPAQNVVQQAGERLVQYVDREHGGFGRAPKFPNPENLRLMLEVGGEARALALQTLTKMAAGGIYDQLGGGFHRYAVDAAWQVPHFEKMLYDNALLVPLYLAAYQLTGHGDYARVARETLDYLRREMTSPEGAWYATQDADSDGQEGKFFVWTPEQVQAVLGAEQGALLCAHYGVTSAGNFEHGQTVLHVAATAEELAAKLGQPSPQVASWLEKGRRRLFAARAQRVRPGRDEKILTAWNGLAISAFAQGGQVLSEPAYTEAAMRAARFILRELKDPGKGLLRRYKDGRAGIAGFLDDHAYLCAGLLDLYEATTDPAWLLEAASLAREMLTRFWSESASTFYLTPAGQSDLIQRPSAETDSSTPSPQSIALQCLLRLHPFTGDDRFRSIAERVLAMHCGVLPEQVWGWASFASALGLAQSGGVEITIATPDDTTAVDDWLVRLNRRFVPYRILTVLRPGWMAEVGPKLAGNGEVPPIWEGRTAHDGKVTVYVCHHFACSAPQTDWGQVEQLLKTVTAVAGNDGLA